MLRKLRACELTLWVASSLVAGPAGAQGFGVKLVSPEAGIVQGPAVTLVAEVSDPRAQAATLVVNGAAYTVPIEQGQVTQEVIAMPGVNRIGIVVEHDGQVARDSLTFHYEGKPMELVVLLGWPSRGEIIDLWVREPGGETCKWDHRETTHGGELLDFSTNAIGFGSQAYVLSEVRPGRYRVKVHYWGSQGDDDQRASWTYDEQLARLDAIDAALASATPDDAQRTALVEERVQVIERLDAWATAGAPQTPVRGEAILFPGTRSERRFRFDVVVHRTGQLTALGEIEVDAASIAAARVGR